jgi:hypothetical protein
MLSASKPKINLITFKNSMPMSQKTLSWHYTNNYTEPHEYSTPLPYLRFPSVLTCHPKLCITYGLCLSGYRNKTCIYFSSVLCMMQAAHIHTWKGSTPNITRCAKRQAMRASLFWDVTQLRLLVNYWRFGTPTRSHLQASRSPKWDR